MTHASIIQLPSISTPETASTRKSTIKYNGNAVRERFGVDEGAVGEGAADESNAGRERHKSCNVPFVHDKPGAAMLIVVLIYVHSMVDGPSRHGLNASNRVGFDLDKWRRFTLSREP